MWRRCGHAGRHSASVPPRRSWDQGRLPPTPPPRGYEGTRVSGNAFWFESKHWKEFCEYEHELDRSLAGQKMIVLCTYSLQASRAVDMLDVARAHQCTITRRNGDWEFLETPELTQAKREIKNLKGA